ncbi:unnamed protein product [Angiostrongylus costaricensis]|uniref:Craniofacial development protein 2-like n=1 Tax=Angiostrongylus costaricensis TaxID=334426 RepID=A0A0R3PT83_ANGCS|nr:unnamed protein product [Angiostrongylus costaricensis]
MKSGRLRFNVMLIAQDKLRERDLFVSIFIQTPELCNNKAMLSMNIDSFEQLTTRIGRLRLKRRGSIPVLTIFVVYAPTSNYDGEEVEAFCMDLEKFHRKDHTFFKVIIGVFNAKIGPRKTSGERYIRADELEWNELGQRLSEFTMTTRTIRSNFQY